MFGWGTKFATSHIPLFSSPAPGPHTLPPWKAGGGEGGGKLYLYGFSSCVARLPRPAPCPSLPQLRAPGGRPPSPLVSRCLQATGPQSAHCPEGAGRPGGPWRRITLLPTPLRESFPVQSLWYKIHFSRDGERWKIHCLLLIPQLFPLSLYRFSESGGVNRKEMRR